MTQKRIDIFLAVILATFVTLVMVISDRPGAARPAAAAQSVEGAPHFATLDVYVDPHNAPFAAYQLEVIPAIGSGQSIRFVGLSDGESHPSFTGKDRVPAYDPHALNSEKSRLIIASLSTDEVLPKEKTRVARLHVYYTGAAAPTFSLANPLVASPEAQKMDAAVTFDLITKN